jgi:alpha-tubulin suppressor-like RCC1 family protein
VGLPFGPLSFTVGDVETGAGSLTVTRDSKNRPLVPISGIILGGSGAARTVTITPAAGLSGFSDITLTVGDGQATTSESFRLSVISPARVPQGSVWKYLAPLTAAAVPANWKAATFADAAWSSGPAPIGFSPNGEDGEATVLPTAGGKPFAVYFRKTVFVSDPLSSPWLQLNLRRDDGAVVYLNGTELWRSNMMETGAVAYDTPARIPLSGSGEFIPVSRVVPGTALVPGDNVFAVEVHQISAGSSDLGFDLEVIPLTYAPPVIARGDDWKYLAPSSAPGAPPSDWKSLAYSDAAWSSGIGVFGYGGDGEVTVLSTASGNPFTAYFRKKFTVADVSRTKGLRLNLRRDDGAVVYLNGVEKWRSNMPEGVGISHTTPARAVTGGVNETTWLTRDVTTAGLVEGENVIAVEVHQNDAASSDLGFDLELLPLNYTPNPPPWISDVSDRTLVPGANTGAIALMVGDAEFPASSLVVSAVSSNPAVIPPTGIAFGGSGASRTVTVTAPPAGQSGSSLIRLTVSDGTGTSETAFVVTVTGASSSVKMAAWGDNDRGQLGNNSTVASSSPVSVSFTGALATKTPVQAAAGEGHSLVLFSDGTLAAWGRNAEGQLGTGNFSSSLVPIAVPMTGALTGKIVTAIDAGRYHSIALCSDGTIACWGDGGYGELGNNGTANSAVPVQVVNSGILAGKTVISVSAGGFHNLALCSDGTIAAWGMNYDGALGINLIDCCRSTPVAVQRTGPLLNRTVISISAGYHSLALCSDGTLAAWGENDYGQLGNNSTSDSAIPVEVSWAGVLSTRTPSSIAAGSYHSLAVCTDGRVAAWGYNGSRQLGDGSTSNRYTPVLVSNSGVLAGKFAHTVAAGLYSSAAVCTDGTAFEWGASTSGISAINIFGILPGHTIFDIAAGSSFKLALTSPPAAPFKVTTMHHIAAGDVFLGFPTLEGVPYRIEWSDGLSAWANWGTVNGTGGELITRLPGYGAIPKRFFRAVVDQ